MAEQDKNICDTVTFSRDTKEVFLPLSSNPSAKTLTKAGIWIAGISVVTDGYHVKRRNHNFHLPIFTLDGTARALTDNGPLKLTPGSVLLVPARSSIEYFPTSKKWTFFWFHIDASFKWSNFQVKEPVLKDSRYKSKLHSAMINFIGESVSRERGSVLAGDLFARLILLYLEREMETSSDNSSLSNVWSAVNQDLAKKWDVDSLAGIARMSPDYFAHASAKAYGLPPMKMVTKLRMDRAKELLLTEDYKLETIAPMVGYDDQFAFSTAFKRHAGVSPKGYKIAKR